MQTLSALLMSPHKYNNKPLSYNETIQQKKLKLLIKTFIII